jgi:hypothetical protein
MYTKLHVLELGLHMCRYNGTTLHHHVLTLNADFVLRVSYL